MKGFDWWDDHHTHITSRPSADGLAALARGVLPGSKAIRTRRLKGGISTATSVVTLRTRGGRTLEVVIKRFRPGRDAVPEWKRLVFAQRLAVASPEPLALDAKGEWFGTPTIAMSRLPGRPNIAPSNIAPWLTEIARAQVAINAASTSRVPATMRTPLPKQAWAPPDGLERTPLVEEATAKIQAGLRGARTRDIVVGHGDPHPGNLLWSRGRISGIADWSAAHLFPRGREVSYTRTDTAILLGVRAADQYLAAYERALGSSVKDLVVWDLMQGLNAMRWYPLWVFAYREQGSSVTQALARRRGIQFVRRALSAQSSR